MARNPEAQLRNDPLIGRRIGDYLVLEKIGAGGMGDVYKAREEKLERIVALKVLKLLAHDDDVQLKRFYREAKAGARLTHPNIVSVFNVGVADGRHFIAMEYVQGADLASILKKKEKLDFREALRVGRGIAQALAAAHEQGIVHRDIKPHNVLVDREGRLKVTDFGIARIAAEAQGNLTQVGEMVGTVRYMSPEQARGGEVDARADIYSLGVVMYECIAGKPPYEAVNPGNLLFKVLNEEPIPLLKVRATTPPQVAQLIHQAMARDPAQRYPTARMLEEDIVSLLKLFAPEVLDASSSSVFTLEDIGVEPGPDTLMDLDIDDPRMLAPGRATSVVGGGRSRTEFNLTLPGAELSRKEYLLVVLQNNMDFRVITGPLVQEVAELVNSTDEAELQPLLEQLDRLEANGPEYAEEFVVWWRAWSAGASRSTTVDMTPRPQTSVSAPPPPPQPPAIPPPPDPMDKVREAIGLFTGLSGAVEEADAVAILQSDELRREPIARLWLARCYYEGKGGLAKDQSRARSIAQGAMGRVSEMAAQRDLEACFILGVVLSEGIGATKNERRAYDLMRMAAEGGYAPAMGKFGTFLKDGVGAARDDAKAVEFYRKAAEAGDAAAMHNLAWMYKEGRGSPKNEKVAVTWYQKAARMGYTPSMNNLAMMYRKGMGVDKDPVEAIVWLDRAANAGNASAMVNLATFLDEGKGCEKDPVKAEEWRRKAAELGDPNAIRALGNRFREGVAGDRDPQEAFKLYSRGAEGGDVNSMYMLGRLLEAGEGTSRDPVKAQMWYERCAQRGHAGAMHRLGRMKADAPGTARDAAGAVPWFERAANAGEKRAMMRLARMYEEGDGVAKTPELASMWYMRAAEAGEPEAMHVVAWMHETGAMGKPDAQLAARWYERAANVGYLVSMNRLGSLYEQGMGVERDLGRAIDWYRKAADGGMKVAREALTRLEGAR